MNWNKPENRKLVSAVLALKNTKEAGNFLRDLLTKDEIDDFAKRLQTAELLTKNTPYTEIIKITGFSSTTVARVSKWLNNGQNGYKTVIARLHHDNLSLKRKRSL